MYRLVTCRLVNVINFPVTIVDDVQKQALSRTGGGGGGEGNGYCNSQRKL